MFLYSTALAEEATEETEDVIMESIEGVSKLFVIYVDGAPVGGVETMADAEGILLEIKEANTVPGAETSEFVQHTEIIHECVNEEKLGKTKEELSSLLDPKKEEAEVPLTVVCTRTEEYKKVVPFVTIETPDDTMYNDESIVTVEGVDGEADVTAVKTYKNGTEDPLSEVVINETVTLKPVDQCVTVGTVERPSTESYGEFIWPTTGNLTSDFGPRNVTIGSSYHQGIDICGDYAQDIVAADGGEVILAEWYGGYGNYVQILHDDGTITAYAHCSDYYVSVGERVFRGQPIAAMGDTGTVSAVHLHFEVLIDGVRCDPLPYLP